MIGGVLGLPPAGPTRFTLDDRVFELSVLDARTWVEALVLEAPGCWWRLIPLHLDGCGAEVVYQRLLDPEDGLDLDDLEQVAERVLGYACGVDFHLARNLAVSVYGNWLAFDGWCVGAGFSPLTEPIGRLLAAALAWRRSLCTTESEARALEAELSAVPVRTASGRPREATVGQWTAEQEERMFLGALETLGRRGNR
ncbi:hypothetical protein GCM10010174_25760 [Kutzneria viridogrisea]|uniref:SUKH-4 immunity protein of toxin-antitoxin system n=1 Tax=Kutzneria viridogrisea TaxID=47990 RepID=A0ABR6BRF1_9PSEU|nr:hypothetical protein [Kutzneria viridogrisea]